MTNHTNTPFERRVLAKFQALHRLTSRWRDEDSKMIEEKEQPRMYFRPKEVAERTGLSIGTVMNALTSKRLKGAKVGSAWLIARSDIHEWVKGGHDDDGAK